MNFSKQLLPDWIGLFDHFPVWVETIIGQIVYVNDSYRDRYGDETPAVIGSRRANPLQFFGARHDDHRRLRSGDNIRVTVVSFAQEIHGNHFFCHIDLPVQDADAAGSGDLEQFPLAALSFDSRHLRLNQRWLDLFGYPAGFFQNHPQWISSLFGQAADEIVQQSPQRNDDSASWVGTITTAAGEYRTLEVWRKVVNGRTTLFATNITAQAELLERLIDENERTRLALAGTQIGIWDWLTGQDIVWLSPELNGLLGYPAIWSQSDFNGFLNLFAIEEQQQIVDYLETHLRLQTPFDLSCRLRLRSGEARWVQLRGQCQRDAAGNAVRMAGSIADISEHRQAMAALATSESQLNTAQQVAHLGNWEWRMADDSMGWSAAMFALHNVPTGNAAPAMESFIRLIYPADQPHVRTLLQQVVSGREAGSTEYRVSSRDGRLQDIWLTCYPHFSGHGELLSLYGTAQDISERKRIERQIAGEKRILEMIAGSRDIADSLGELCLVVEEQLIGAHACIQLLDEQDQQLIYVAAPNLPAEFQRASEILQTSPYSGSCAAAVTLRRTVITEDIASDSVWSRVRYLALNHGLRACWATPILSKSGRIVGALGLYFEARLNANEFERSLLERMAQLAGIAIENNTVELALKQSEERWHFALEGSQDGVWDWRLDSNEAYYSRRCEAILAMPDGERLESELGQWQARIHPDDRHRVAGAYNNYLAGQGEHYACEYRVRCHDGNYRWVLVRGKIIGRDDDGKPLRIIGTLTDISAAKQAEEELRLNAQVFESAGEGILITDRYNRIISVNQAFSKITGYLPDEVLGSNPSLLASGQHDKEFYRELWATLAEHDYWQGEIWNRRKNGEHYPEWLTITVLRRPSGEIANYIATFSDLSERKQQAEHIQFLANFDSLTHLPNRLLFKDRVELAIASAQRLGTQLAVLVIDLDRFKNINDSLGHHVGDRLLQETASRITATLSEVDTSARLGGDEFVILLNDLRQPQDAVPAARRLLEAISRPIAVEQNELRLTPSIGIAVFPDDGTDFDTLVKNADAAMYHAKDNGRNNYQFFTAGLNARVLEQLILENALRRALERQEMAVYFQPQYRVGSGEIVGAEALLRWRHPELGMVSPARFIPVAEDSGLISQISEWVLQSVCNHICTWREHGLAIPPIAINISSSQFRQLDFVSGVIETLGRSGIAPDLIELELTESILMQDFDIAVANMRLLRASGFHLAIDDFGTGYSSLSYLKRFPIHKLKIDQSFVRELPGDSDSAAITGAIINLAHNLQLKVIAEGVETSEQLDFLVARGCDEIQGFLFSKPLPAEDFSRLLGNKPIQGNRQ